MGIMDWGKPEIGYLTGYNLDAILPYRGKLMGYSYVDRKLYYFEESFNGPVMIIDSKKFTGEKDKWVDIGFTGKNGTKTYQGTLKTMFLSDLNSQSSLMPASLKFNIPSTDKIDAKPSDLKTVLSAPAEMINTGFGATITSSLPELEIMRSYKLDSIFTDTSKLPEQPWSQMLF